MDESSDEDISDSTFIAQHLPFRRQESAGYQAASDRHDDVRAYKGDTGFLPV